MPRGGRIGRGVDGKWQTTALKEYPDGLCRAFATLFMSRCDDSGPEQELPLWFVSSVQNLVADFNEEAVMGPDCCRDTVLNPAI